MERRKSMGRETPAKGEMTAVERMQQLARAMPRGSTIALPDHFMAQLAGEIAVPVVRPAEPMPDIPLTVAQTAELLGKASSTVRGWLNEGRLPGAFKLHGKEWRIPMEAIEAMMRPSQPVPTDHPTNATEADGDLGAWRRHLRSA